MTGTQEAANAMAKRSLRNIQTELEFLADSSIITQQQLSSITALLPHESNMRVPVSNGTPTVTSPQPPTNQLANTSLNEKHQNGYFAPSPSPSPLPPPAYGQAAMGPPPLTMATSLYAYNPTDAGDLALLPNDQVAVLEYVNAEWWKGRNTRTEQEGIFPRNYVRVVEEKSALAPAPVGASGSNYGNMPVAVSQGGQSPGSPGKFENGSKKVGKKMGNAVVFGAGATMGSKLVNSIF
ncbi:MAG: hypothetical protein M4579_005210 [Chaenotheca gracillima]|nr:MAG: hypothetical protein M4579_005210 [Chaenotheca gracillima]